MSYSKRSRYSRSPSPYKQYSRSVSRSVSWSRSMSRSRSRSREPSIENPGNNLYVTGLSTRITKRDLEKHFSTEGTVVDVHLVVDPWTRVSRGFGFVTMSTVEEADRCIEYLDRSVLEGRVIMVEKARRRRGRTPTPGRYLGLRTIHARRRRSPSYSPHGRSRSPRYSSERGISRSYSPCYRRRRSYSPYYERGGLYPPHHSRGRSYSRSPSPYSRSAVSRRDRSYSPYYRSRYHSVSRRISPRVRSSRRSYSRSVSPRLRRSSRRSYSRSVSPRPSRRSYYHSISPGYRRSSRRSYSRSLSPRPRKSSSRGGIYPGSFHRRDYTRDSHSSRSYSTSESGSPCSKSVSRSLTPRSGSPSP